jgi:methyl-accepting chemotaxis protein
MADRRPPGEGDIDEPGDDRETEAARRLALSRLDDLERSFQGVSGRLAGLETRIGSAVEELAERMAALQRQTGEVASGSLEALSRSLEADQGRAAQELTRRLGELSDRFRNEVTEAVRRVGTEEGPGVAESVRGEIQAAVEPIRGRIADIAERARSLEGEIGSVSDAVRQLSGAMESLRTELAGMAESVDARAAGSAESLRAEAASATEHVRAQVEGLRGELASSVESLHEELAATASNGRAAALAESLSAHLEERFVRLRTELETSVREVVTRLEASRPEDGSAVGERLLTMGREVEDALARARARAAAETASMLDEIRGAAARVNVSLGPIEARIGEALALQQERLSQTVAPLAGRLAELQASIGIRVADALAPVEIRVSDLVSSMEPRIAEALRPELERVAGALRSEVPESIGLLRQEVEATRRRTDRLEEGLTRVGRLADAVETIGRRRAFRQLAQTEEELVRQQAAQVERVTEAGTTLGRQAEELSGRLRPLADAGERFERLSSSVDRLGDDVGRRMRTEVEEIRSLLADEVRDVFAERWNAVVRDLRMELEDAVSRRTDIRSLRDVARAQRDLERTVSALRAAVGETRARLDDWGRPRSSQRLGKALDEVVDRVVSLEREVHQTAGGTEEEPAPPGPVSEPEVAPARPVPRRRRWFRRRS